MSEHMSISNFLKTYIWETYITEEGKDFVMKMQK